MSAIPNFAAIRLILVEDSPSDVLLLREALNAHVGAYELRVLGDGSQAMAFIESVAASAVPDSDLFILDLNLPCYHGLDILSRLKQHGALAKVPVIILTSSCAPEEHEAGKRLGAAGFITKPCGFEEYIAVGATVRDFVGKAGSTAA